MRAVPAALAASLASGVTRLAHCWIVTRRDGVVLGFTEHDRALVVEGVVCAPESGFDSTTLDVTLGGQTDGSDIIGALSDARITRTDIDRGLWDGATVRHLLVDWADPAQAVVLEVSTIGEITVTGLDFTAELRSALRALSDQSGRIIERGCRHTLGDALCGVDLEARRVSAVIDAAGADWIEAVAFAGAADGTFSRGVVRLPGGEEVTILAHSGARLVLFEAPATPLSTASTISAVPGCDKQWATCVDRFENAAAYGGFPHVPGSDAVVQVGAYPGQEGGVSQFDALDPAPLTGAAVASVEGRGVTVSFDPVPVYVVARVDGAERGRAYGMTGQVGVGGLSPSTGYTISLTAERGTRASDPVEVYATTGVDDASGGGDGGEGNSGGSGTSGAESGDG